MQHQSQGFDAATPAGKAGILDSGTVVTSAEIERHIAAGKRMQAEAIAAFLKGGFRRLVRLVHHDRSAANSTARNTGALPPVQGEHLSRA